MLSCLRKTDPCKEKPVDDATTERRLSLPTAEMRCATAIGFYLAWWNEFHDEGFLLLKPIAGQVASCLACYGGVLVAAVIVLAIRKRALPFNRFILLVAALGQLLCGFAFYYCIFNQHIKTIAILQAIQGTLTFGIIFLLLPCFQACKFPSLPRLIVIVLAVYALSECACWFAVFFASAPLARIAAHIALWIAATAFARSQLAEMCWQQRGTVHISKSQALPLRLPFQLVLSASTYWFVFGVTHVLASGVMPTGEDKLLPCYAGSLLATIIFLLAFGSMRPGDKIWPKMRLCVFPLTMSSFLLLAFANSTLTFLSISFSQCAMDTYAAFYALSFFVIARKLHCSVLQTASRGALIAVPAIMAGVATGVLIGANLNALVALIPQFYNVLSIIAFILLVAGTFWVGDDRRISLVWGLEKKLTPKRFEDDAIAERCAKAIKRFGLTKREGEILAFLAHGQNATTIAEDQVISINTVRTHIARIHRKMGVSNQRELVARLEEEG